MYTQALVAAAFATTLAAAFPTSDPSDTTSSYHRRDNGLVVKGTPASAPQNLCGVASFLKDDSGNAPAVADCQALADNMRRTNSVYTGYGWRPETGTVSAVLVAHGTCAFGVRPWSGSSPPDILVGNTDIADLIESSIKGYGSGDSVATFGNMACQDSTGRHPPVWWRVFHS